MSKKILVALDGSRTSETILPHLERLVKAVDVQVCLAHVAPLHVLDASDEQEYLDKVKARMCEKFPDVDAALLSGEPATELLGYAMAHKFDMIAMTTHARTGIGKLIFGSVAEKILRQSPIPVFLVRPNAKPSRFRTIVVPLDGSDRAARILPLAAEMARGSGAKIVLLSIAPTPIPPGPASHNLLKAERQIRGQGIECELVVRSGKPVDQILDVVKREPAELIAITTHGRSGLSRLRFGSVTEEALRKSTVPMLVLRTAGSPPRELLLTARYYRNLRWRLEKALKK